MTDKILERIRAIEERVLNIENRIQKLEDILKKEAKSNDANRRLNLIIRLVLYSIVIIILGLLFLFNRGYIKI